MTHFVLQISLALTLFCLSNRVKQYDLERTVRDLNTQFRLHVNAKGGISKLDIDGTKLVIAYRDRPTLKIDLAQVTVESEYKNGKSWLGFRCEGVENSCFPVSEPFNRAPGLTVSITKSILFDSYNSAVVAKQNIIKIQKMITE